MLHYFSKYSACGNDFILFDNRNLLFPECFSKVVPQLCHRQKGIGADGVILLENSPQAHYKMRIFNADGSEAEMCGNGIRCLFRFIQEMGIQEEFFNIETMLGILRVSSENQNVAVEMSDPKELRWSLPLFSWEVHHLNTGVPHTVVFLSHIDHLDVDEYGSKIRFHPLFAPRGTNVNFVQVNANDLYIRTYERGVGESLACGTGATAAALVASKIYGLKAPITVKVRSGDSLKIDFKPHEDSFTQVKLIGSCQLVFRGSLEIN